MIVQYKIIVDTQDRSHPTKNKKTYLLNIDELLTDGTDSDKLVITKDNDYVLRYFKASEFNVMSKLDTPYKEPIDININLFEGTNFVYIENITGEDIYAEYIIKNDFTDVYVTKNTMNSTISESIDKIELSISQKLTDYSKTNDMDDAINTAVKKAKDDINSTTDNKLKDYATTKEMNAAIKLSTDGIEQKVSEKLITYSTTDEMNNAIGIAKNDVNSETDNKLKSYPIVEEVNSAIEQKADSIRLSVSKTLENYSTTNEMNSAIGEKTKNNLETVTVEYALGTSTTTAPTSGWSTTAPTWQQGKYMWQRTKTKTADGTESISNPTCIAGAKGQDGTNGTNGVSVSSITEYYAVSTSNSSAPADSSFQTAVQTMTTTNKYLWNYELITYSNNTTSKTSKRVIGVYGDKGNPGTNGTNGTNGIGISSIVNKYAVSSSNSTAPSSWSNTPQTMTATNKYLWNYEIITYSNNTTYTSTPAVIGTYGEKGNIGDTGKGVKAVVSQYYLSSSKTSQTGGSWAETQPAYKKDYYYWTRTKITWTDNTTTYTTPILVEEINSLNESVASLNIRAGDIESTVRKKVGNDEIISKINQSAEKVQIDAKKISLVGKEINLTSDKINIASTNFNVDKDGKLTCSNANVTGTITSSNATITGGSLKVGENFSVDKDGNVNVANLVTTGKGIYTNLHTVGALYQSNNLAPGMDFFGIMENNYGGTGDITKTQLCFFIYVPTGFVVEEAYINLTIIPIKWNYLGKQYWGYARNIGLYKGEIPDWDTAAYASEAYSTTYNIGTKINFLSDSSNWKPENDKTLSTNHKKVSKTSKNISSEITTGNNFLIIQTDNNPSISDDMHELAEQTGKALGFLDIYGYLPR